MGSRTRENQVQIRRKNDRQKRTLGFAAFTMVGEQTAILDKYDDTIADPNAVLEQGVASMQLSAISMAVRKGGELIWARALGLRDLESGTPVSLDIELIGVSGSSGYQLGSVFGVLDTP